MSHSDPASTSGVVARAQQIMARKLTLVHLGVEHVNIMEAVSGSVDRLYSRKKKFPFISSCGIQFLNLTRRF